MITWDVLYHEQKKEKLDDKEENERKQRKDENVNLQRALDNILIFYTIASVLVDALFNWTVVLCLKWKGFSTEANSMNAVTLHKKIII
uniref:Uncharacterized protein n=1 Tax=Romanomermis culicivorax TaxID=13658 RepID=A0A915IGJ9_ROMCU